MKNLRTFIAVVMLSIACMTWAKDSFLSALSGQDDVTTVTLNKFMLSVASASGDEGNSISGGDLLKNLDKMAIYTAEAQSGAEKINAAVKNDIQTLPGLETMLEVKDDDDVVTMYGIPSGENTYSEAFMWVKSSDSTVLIVFWGKLTPADFANVMNDGIPGL